MQGSKQDWIGLNRPPRVQITYDVEIGGAIQKVELPLVVGVISDLSGDTPNEVALLKDRPFVEIDRDNFDGVFKKIAPMVKVSLTKIGDETTTASHTIAFQSMDDFKPDNLVKTVPGIQELYKLRNLLTDLAAKLDGNTELDKALVELGASGTANQRFLAGAFTPESSPTDLTKIKGAA